MNPDNNQNPNPRIQKIEQFLLDPDKALFESIEELAESLAQIQTLLSGVDLGALEQIQGIDGVTPKRGIDFMNEEDLSGFESFILSKIPKEGVNYPSISQVEEFIKSQVATIPRIKGDPGKDGSPGTPGRNGSPDSPAKILEKIRSLGRNQGIQISDVRGLRSSLNAIPVLEEEISELRETLANFKIVIPPSIDGGPSTISWGDIVGAITSQSDLMDELNLKANVDDLGATAFSNDYADLDNLPDLSDYLTDITGFIEQGTNVTITGSGTEIDPYVISSTGGGGGSVDWGSIGGTLSSQTDLAAAFALKLDEADFTLVNLGINASAAELNVLDGITSSTAELNILDGVTSTAAELNILDGVTATTAELNILDGVIASTTELNYVDGVTSAIQTQINGKQATITGGATTIVSSNLTASRALVSDGSGKVAVSSITSTQLGYLSGVTSNIQTQIDALSSAVVLKGTWDASAGTFPGGGVAQAGWSYIVSVGGTVNGVQFSANDRIVAITNNASTSTYAANWFKLDYTDAVLSVAGKTGAVTLDATDIYDGSISNTEFSYLNNVTSNIQTQINAKISASSADTLTNKRVQVRIESAASGDISPDLASYNLHRRTNLSAAIAINAPTGTPVHGEVLTFDLTSTSNRALTWNAIFVFPDGETAPNVTANKWLKVSAQYNSTASKWMALQTPVYTL